MPMSEWVAGTCLGKYELIAEVGRGGVATVYLAVTRGSPAFQKLFAVKVLNADVTLDDDEMAMFENEARLAARLNHPNIVQSLEFGQQDGRYYLAMEYLQGQPLSRIAQRSSSSEPFPLDFHLSILRDVLTGLHHAHELKDYDGTALTIVHRDVSPHNVFVTYDGVVKLLDFGIAKAAGFRSDTVSGALKGKVAYMSPDQFGDAAPDRRVDVFAVGVMLWEALAHQRLWKGLADVEIIRALMLGKIPSVQSAAPELSPELAAVCMKALAADPNERYSTAAEFRADLDRWLQAAAIHITQDRLGEHLVGRFAKERDRTLGVIQKQLGRHYEQDSRGSEETLPTLSAGEGSDSGARSREDAGSGTGSHSASGKSRATTGAVAKHITTDQQAGLGAKHSRRLPLIGAASFVALGAIAAGLFTARKHPSLPVLGSTNWEGAVPSDVASMAPVEVLDQIELTVSATPESARIELDGEWVGRNPYVAKRAKSPTNHSILIHAEGFEPHREILTFDRDQTIGVALKPLAKPAAVPPRPAVPTASVRPTGVPAVPTTPGVRPIDDKNPFIR
jgi:eukaryotic-like serine/threonine-protein kinase